MEKIIDTILGYVEPDDEITGQSLLRQDCGLSSFDTTCVIGELCDMYGVEDKAINPREIKTVEDLYNALETAKAAKA